MSTCLSPYKTVFMDCDGVLFDFTRNVLCRFGASGKPYPRGEWSIPKVLGISDEEMWKTIDTLGFWSGLTAFDGAAGFLSTVLASCAKVQASLAFCTKSSPNVAAFAPARCAAVRELCREAGYAQEPQVYICCGNGATAGSGGGKGVFGGPGRLLVDDHPSHLADFHCAGGGTFFVPMTWNTAPWETPEGCKIGLTPDYEWITPRLVAMIEGSDVSHDNQ